MDLLVPTDRHTTCPYKGEASYWSVHAGGTGRRERGLELSRADRGRAAAGRLHGLLLGQDGRVAGGGRARDRPRARSLPPHRRRSTPRGTCACSVNGEAVADTTRARVLFETGLPPRWYIPPRRRAHGTARRRATRRTGCAYKGYASYWSVGGRVEDDWSGPTRADDARRSGSATTSRSSTSAWTSRSTASYRSAPSRSGRYHRWYRTRDPHPVPMEPSTTGSTLSTAGSTGLQRKRVPPWAIRSSCGPSRRPRRRGRRTASRAGRSTTPGTPGGSRRAAGSP